MIDIGPAYYSFNQKNAPVGISLRLYGKEKKKWREGGKEDPSALIFLPLSTQPYKTSPLRILPLENSPCSVNLEKKLEGAETGCISFWWKYSVKQNTGVLLPLFFFHVYLPPPPSVIFSTVSNLRGVQLLTGSR